MIFIKAEYKIKKNKLDLVKPLICEFIQSVQNEENGTYMYKSFCNNSNFLHIMSFIDKKSKEAHKDSIRTKEFINELSKICSKKPKFSELELVDGTLNKRIGC